MLWDEAKTSSSCGKLSTNKNRSVFESAIFSYCIHAELPEWSNGTGLGQSTQVYQWVCWVPKKEWWLWDTCWLSAYAGSNPALRILFNSKSIPICVWVINETLFLFSKNAKNSLWKILCFKLKKSVYLYMICVVLFQW